MRQALWLQILAAVLLLSEAVPSAAQNLSSTQYQFMEAARKGNVQKARDLMELANLKPNDFAGQPFVKWMFTEGDGGLNAMTDEAFLYVFKELKQPFDIKKGRDGDYTIFSMFCVNTGAGTYNQKQTIGGLHRTQNRINYALNNGGSPKHVQGVGWASRRWQPLPRCVEEYFRWRHDPQARSTMLAIIDTLIKAGADPQYDRPLEKAADKYDEQLFQALVDNGARIDHVFPVSHETDSTCGKHGLPPNTIIAKIPNPRDQDIALARPFLEAVIDAGGDIMEKQNFVRYWSGKCERQHVTLVERALAFGQTAYAKMVLELAKERPVKQRELPKTLPLSTAAPSSAPLSGSRVVTSSFNVREQPALDGALMSTLGPNTVFEIEDATADGQWTRINAVPIVRGWANTAVIRKSSVPNAPTETSSTAKPEPPASNNPDTPAMRRTMLFLVTGIDAPPYRVVEEFHNAHGDHIKTQTHTYEPTFETPCIVKLRYTSAAKKYTPSVGRDFDNFTSLRRFDFTKMTRIAARYTEQPEEGLWWAFAGGPSNPRLRKPRFVTLIDFFGADASCSLKDDGTNSNCSKAEQSNGNFPFPDPSKKPNHYEQAFAAIKAVCARQ